jgi:prepilin-type N-terminal cleavage/methylation domain-containing protein
MILDVPFRPRPPTRRAFTLVELLVVVAVIALLAAILMPSLRRSLELARGSVCQTQLRNQANACNQFGGENDQRLPDLHDYARAYNDSGSLYSPYWLSGTWVNRLMDQYSVRREFFYCPSNHDGWNLDPLWEHHFANDQRVTRIIGYSYFGAHPGFSVQGKIAVSFLEDPPSYPVFARTLIDKPAYQALWVDLTRNQPNGDWWTYDAAWTGKRLGVNHFLYNENKPDGMNEAYADESVRWVPWRDRTNGFGSWTQHF